MRTKAFGKYVWVVLFLVLVAGMTATISAQAQKKADPSVPIENLSFQAADIRSVIRFLADYGKVNVVVAPNVQGSVTINLTDVTWDQALKIIGRTYGLAVVFEEDNYIRIVPAEEYRKEMTEIEKHNVEQLTLASLDVRIVRLANTSASEIAESVKGLMTERGKVDYDQRTNALILQEVPDNIERVVDFIKQLDRPARQIKISAQLLEINSSNDLEFGVDWTVNGGYTSDGGNQVDQTGDLLLDRVTDPAFSYQIGMLMKDWTSDAIASIMEGEGSGKIVAHPEITTVENKEARIQLGQKVPIKTFDESGNVVTQFEEVGTILKVTPTITAENQILMHLRPERSSVQTDPSGIIINTSNAETNVVVANGQTAVIGGLTSQIESESKVGVPILKDIPLIGYLFSYTRKEYEDRDLVIFVTPTIVEPELAASGN